MEQKTAIIFIFFSHSSISVALHGSMRNATGLTVNERLGQNSQTPGTFMAADKLKLNCDASVSLDQRKATAGGVFRNHLGSLGVRASRLLVESDSQLAIRILKQGCDPSNPCYSLALSQRRWF
ncbi:hypothetical protein HKD37_10G028978 [Glycine soja]